MTSDAKIGLLLGLVFIFVIAFIINGLPSFRKDASNNELTTNMVSLRNNPPGLAAKERKVSREIINQMGQVKKVPAPSADEQSIRFETALPKSTSVVKETNKTIEIKRTTSPALSEPIIAKKREVKKARPVRPTLPKIYVVADGDNLAVIAKKFYGDEEGNKRINITRIFEANTKFLGAPDGIYVGQKLVIPPLSACSRGRSKTDSVLAGPMLEKVESIGKRHLLKDSRRIKQSRRYVVQEGDSLWRIAAEQLGDGSRYSEIAKLNADIIDDQDWLFVGMRLRIPVR